MVCIFPLVAAMAPKMQQLLLSFSPRVRLPAVRTEGAVVVQRVDEHLPPPADQHVMGPEPPPKEGPA